MSEESAAIEAEATDAEIEFEWGGRTWLAKPTSRIHSLRFTRLLTRDRDLAGALAEVIGEEQLAEAEDLIVGPAALQEFSEAAFRATGAGSPGESQASLPSSKNTARRSKRT